MQTDIEKGKTNAIIAYLTIFGAVIAIFLNQDEKKSEFTSMHIRQALGLFLSFFMLGYFIGYFNSWAVSSAFYLFYFILLLFGFINAIQGENKPIPLVGVFFQNLFKML